MKVKELQEKLKNLDPNFEVVCYKENEGLDDKGRGFVLFDIVSIDLKQAELTRINNGIPYLKFDQSELTEKFAILEVTEDF